MFILDEEKLKEYWEGIAKGFEQSPFELIFTLIFIILLITLLVLIVTIYQGKKRKRIRENARSLFEQILKNKQTSEADRAIINLLIPHFPKPPEYIQELLTDQGLFFKSAKPLLDNGTITSTTLAMVRKRLGLIKERNIITYHSTAELSQGISLVLFYKSTEYKGKIIEVDDKGLKIQTSAPLIPGEHLHVQFIRQTGSYSFSSIIKGKHGNLAEILHSETIDRIQNRDFYRVPVRLHAEIKPLEITGTTCATIISEISGSGALLYNPQKRFLTGDEFFLIFSPPGKKPIQVRGKVVRLIQGTSKICIAFTALKEGVRDNIIRFVMNVK